MVPALWMAGGECEYPMESRPGVHLPRRCRPPVGRAAPRRAGEPGRAGRVDVLRRAFIPAPTQRPLPSRASRMGARHAVYAPRRRLRLAFSQEAQ